MEIEKRFSAVRDTRKFRVIAVPLEDFNEMDDDEREEVVVVEFHRNGFVSDTIAKHWIEKIADQLNDFDAANLTVAKLT